MSYRSHADLGGQVNHDRVMPEPEGELFHAVWEARALAVTLAMGGTGSWNIDMSRAARETLPDYARLSYYQIWIGALEKMLAGRGLALPDELAASHALHASAPVARVLRAADVPAALAKGSPTERHIGVAARFKVGDAVRMRSDRVAHHTRLPAYARGKLGVIEGLHGAHVFADTHAQGLGEQPQWLYRVAFGAQALWGEDADPGSSVSLDAWEDYLLPAAA